MLKMTLFRLNTCVYEQWLQAHEMEAQAASRCHARCRRWTCFALIVLHYCPQFLVDTNAMWNWNSSSGNSPAFSRSLLIVPCGIEIEAFEAVRALKKLLIVDATYRTTWIWKSCDLSNRKAFSRLFFRPKTARFAALFTWIRTNGKTHISRVYFFMLVQIYSLEKM